MTSHHPQIVAKSPAVQLAAPDRGGERAAELRAGAAAAVLRVWAGARAAPAGGRGVHLHEQGHLRLRPRHDGRLQHGQRQLHTVTVHHLIRVSRTSPWCGTRTSVT